ncbi:unnamed protein product [Effrenium voratum]|nr:unnamed protein product [Effrenium voratum]
MQADPLTASLQDEQLFEKLAQQPDVRKHMADAGFIAELEKLQKLACEGSEGAGQKVAQAAHRDPRIMQALMALQGQGLVVDESDLRKAESVGDMPRREPVQLEQMLLVKDLQDAEEARRCGNEHFKAGRLPEALAHYVPASSVAALLSNAALCLLKLKWPDRAKKKATAAIVAIKQAGDTSFDQSKLYYRRALACEELKEFGMAVEDMSRACLLAKDSASSEQHRLKAEVERLKKLKASAEAEAERKQREKLNEKAAEQQRLQGAQVKGGISAQVSSEYLAEQDFSHWAQGRVRDAVIGVTHTAQSGATLEIVKLAEQSKVSASITHKKGKRALYYDMDLHCEWLGKSAGNELSGLIRVYNIAHDTKFELGGDENTSYMYQLGWDRRKTGSWTEELTTEAAELFDLVALKVDGVIKDLRKK